MTDEIFEVFKQKCGWFVRPGDDVDLKKGSFTYSEIFTKAFPCLYKLLSLAVVIDISITRNKAPARYKLFSWNGHSGWLCKLEPAYSAINILPEHQCLLDTMGGIQESYYQTALELERLTDNQEFMFIQSQCYVGMDEDTYHFYRIQCDESGVKPVDTQTLICFAVEANGNQTYYDPATKSVLLFAPDHSFNHVEPLDNQPEYTFYTIDQAENFVAYVETLSRQWLEIVQPKDE